MWALRVFRILDSTPLWQHCPVIRQLRLHRRKLLLLTGLWEMTRIITERSALRMPTVSGQVSIATVHVRRPKALEVS